jgi:hypothetical protein
MASNASKTVSMITQLHGPYTGTVSTSDVPHDTAMDVAANDCDIIERANQSGRRLRNIFLVGNAVAWIVIIFAARALLF